MPDEPDDEPDIEVTEEVKQRIDEAVEERIEERVSDAVGDNEENEGEFSRRSFLKKVGLGVAGLGAASLIPSGSAYDIRSKGGLEVFKDGDRYLDASGDPVAVENADFEVSGNIRAEKNVPDLVLNDNSNDGAGVANIEFEQDGNREFQIQYEESPGRLRLRDRVNGRAVGLDESGFFELGSGLNLRLVIGQSIEDDTGVERVSFQSNNTRIRNAAGELSALYQDNAVTQHHVRDGVQYRLFDEQMDKPAYTYTSTASAPGTLELSNAELNAGDNQIRGLARGETASASGLRWELESSISSDDGKATVYIGDDNDVDIEWARNVNTDSAFRVLDRTNVDSLFNVTDAGLVEIPNGDLRLSNNGSIEDKNGTRRLTLFNGTTTIFSDVDDFSNVIQVDSSDGVQINTNTLFEIRDQAGTFNAISYQPSSSAPGTLELTNADQRILDGNELNFAASGYADVYFERNQSNGRLELFEANKILSINTVSGSEEFSLQNTNLKLPNGARFLSNGNLNTAVLESDGGGNNNQFVARDTSGNRTFKINSDGSVFVNGVVGSSSADNPNGVGSPAVYTSVVEAPDEKGGESTYIEIGNGGFHSSVGFDQIALVTLGEVKGKINAQGDYSIEGSFTEGASLDLAENIRVKEEQKDSVEVGDVVGIEDGEVTRSTEEAAVNMVVSAAPGITLGGKSLNLSEEEKEKFENSYRAIAFAGQVPVKVRGDASEGDYLLPSGEDDGTAVAVPEDEVSFDQYRDAIGVVLNEFEIPGNVNDETAEKYEELLDEAGNEDYKIYNVAVGVK